MDESTRQPDARQLHNAAGLAEDLLLDDLVAQTLALETFERDVHGLPAPIRLVPSIVTTTRSKRSVLWLSSGLAAAVALAVTVGVLMQRAQPSTTGVLQAGRATVGPSDIARDSTASTLAADVASGIASDATHEHPALRDASAEAEVNLASFAFLDPEIAHGLPSLTAEKTLVMAVYQTSSGNPAASSSCECLAWSVEDASDPQSLREGVLNEALRQPCADGTSSLTLVKVTGPRVLLPFHESEVRELARCVTPRDNCDELCAFEAATDCVASDLKVQTRTIEWASR